MALATSECERRREVRWGAQRRGAAGTTEELKRDSFMSLTYFVFHLYFDLDLLAQSGIRNHSEDGERTWCNQPTFCI